MSVGVIHRDAASAAFFDGTSRGELLLRRCTTCGHASEPATETCPACTGRELDWEPAAGTGVLVSWAVVHTRSQESTVRTPVGLVELDEGPWLEMQVVGIDPDRLVPQLRIHVGFERPEGGETLPVARPVDID
ncbi:Zn-ribbon domain-containing OB-fold protein [Pseudonocardia halophobica]|uniref:Zn-ribbon domain-containing OB-fold protein n=1 Tax=Pseudonocardia halophobica TaxID=29401 RepID=UPI003D9492E0